MMKKYQNLKKYKRAYVVCAAGQSYIDSTEGMIKALSEFSDYTVILYYTNGVVNYEYDNLIKQPFRLVDKEISPEHSLKLLTTLKAEVTLNSIKRYDVETVVMLDSDIIVTPYIDTVFEKYENEIENYPIFIKYAWDIVTVMGRPLVSEYIKNIIGATNPKINAVCSCMCIANRNCISFLEDWKYWCENDALINYHYVQNKDIYFDFNDESIVNALLWKYNATKILPTNLQWAWKHESVKFSLDFYNGKTEELQRHESLYNTHWKIPEKYEVPFGLSVIPFDKKDLWGFHGPKDLNEINLIINELKNNFKENMDSIELQEKNKRNVYQISMFRNELDLLELQLEEMHNIVDKFIIVESNKSHSGQEKELVFEKNKERFSKFKNKIIHLICDFDSEGYYQYKQKHIESGIDEYVSEHDEWMREWYQRDYALSNSGVKFNDNDLILSLDIDEIVNAESLDTFLKTNKVVLEPYRLEMHFMHYYLDTNLYSKITNLDKKWYYPALIQYSELKRFNNSLAFLRVRCYSEEYVIKEGGWHFTFLYDADEIINKVNMFSHCAEDRFKVDVDHVKNAIDNLELFYEKDHELKLRHFPINKLPNTIQNNIEKWSKFLKQKFKKIKIPYENKNLNDVLVVVAGHTEDENKKLHALHLLNSLKDDNLNTCYVTHCSKYIDEYSNIVDFLVYDKNNLLINNSDYIHNVDIFDDTFSQYGSCTFYSQFLPYGTFTGNVITAHCPALMILLKNAIDLANANKFKWIVFMEYDIIPPTNGFLNFIQDKINSLIDNNKKCILYPRPKTGFIYPGVLIFDPNEVLKHPIFLKEEWYTSIRNWLKYWKVGFSETITEHVLIDTFNENIIEYDIEEDAKKYWNVDDYNNINKFDTLKERNRHLITLVPSKKLDKFSLHIYICNPSYNQDLNLISLRVINDTKNTLLYEIENKLVTANEWYFDTINGNNYDSNDRITLTYVMEKEKVIKTHTEVYDVKYIENIYKYVRKVEFNEQ